MQNIKKIDWFSVPIQLNFKKKSSHQTILGGIVTFMIGIIISTTFYYLGKEVYFKENP